jgi:hypothetical protein
MNAWFGRVGSKDALPDNKPSVWLVTDSSFTYEEALLVAAGCEEEGVPLAWDIKSGDFGESAELSRMACLRSRLEVGLGVDSHRKGTISLVAVTDAPYIKRDADTPARLRWLGQTAARMSKGEPIAKDSEMRD